MGGRLRTPDRRRGRCRERAAVGPGRARRRRPARQPGRRAAGPDRRLVQARNRLDAELARTGPDRRAHPGRGTRRAEVDGVVAARASAGSRQERRTRSCATAAPWSISRPWPRRAPRGWSPPSRWRCSPRSPGRRIWPPPPRRASTWPRSTRCWPRPPPPASTRSWARWCTTTWPGSTPTAPNPTPPRAGRCRIARHADGSRTFRGQLDAVGGEKFEAMLESHRAGRPARRGQPHARPATRRRPRAARRHRPGLGPAADPAHRQAARRRHHPAADLVDPAPAPARRAPGSAPRSPPPGPAGWPATAPSPASSSAPRASRWTWAAQTGRPTAPAPRRRAARPALRVRRLPRPQPLVRRPPPGALGRRRRDLPGELRPALRTPPHQGPPRLPDRPRHPTADGTPTAPTAPRSSSTRSSSERSGGRLEEHPGSQPPVAHPERRRTLQHRRARSGRR